MKFLNFNLILLGDISEMNSMILFLICYDWVSIEFFSNRLRFSSPMNLNFAFFTAEPVSVLSETIAKNTCKMVSETIGDDRRRKGDNRGYPRWDRSWSPMSVSDGDFHR